VTTTIPMLPEEAAAAAGDGRPGRGRWRGRGGSWGRGRWRVLLRTPGRVSGVTVIAVFALMAIIGPYLYPASLPIDPGAIYASPSLAHPLGTDFEGTDVLALIVTGARYVLLSAVIAAVVMVVVGAAAGITAGYFRGPPDSIIMRVTDLVLTIPGFPVLIVLSTVWDFGSPYAMGLVLGIFGWGGLARAVRSQTLSLRERGFLEAARGLGLPARHIVLREVAPNVAPYVAMNLLLSVTGAIYAETGLFFLGVVPFNAGNWGVMLNIAVFSAGAVTSPQALTYLLSPLVCILALTLAIVVMLNAVDEWFNPRLREP
jgi:peptide/nickel transport system permease protein